MLATPAATEIESGAIVGFIIAIVVLVGAIGGLVLFFRWTIARDRRAREAREAAERARWDALAQRFGPEIAGRIWRKEIWQGQTEEMLVAALGAPVEIDEEVLKTKRKHVFKYGHQGANRFATRITLENGVVVGWKV
jgi:hypothetical protein